MLFGAQGCSSGEPDNWYQNQSRRLIQLGSCMLITVGLPDLRRIITSRLGSPGLIMILELKASTWRRPWEPVPSSSSFNINPQMDMCVSRVEGILLSRRVT